MTGDNAIVARIRVCVHFCVGVAGEAIVFILELFQEDWIGGTMTWVVTVCPFPEGTGIVNHMSQGVVSDAQHQIVVCLVNVDHSKSVNFAIARVFFCHCCDALGPTFQGIFKFQAVVYQREVEIEQCSVFLVKLFYD